MSRKDDIPPGLIDTEYDVKTHPREAIKAGQAGVLSRGAMAAELGITLGNFRRWERDYESFRLAVDRAMGLAQRHWEEKLRATVDGGKSGASPGTILKALEARFAGEWQERWLELNLPFISSASDLLECQTRVVMAVASGRLDVDGGQALMAMLDKVAGTFALVMQDERLKAVEERLRISTVKAGNGYGDGIPDRRSN